MAVPLPADLSKVDPSEAWKPWAPTADERWDRHRVAHLYRRAAFGATPGEIDRALTDGFPKTLERLLKGDPGSAAENVEVLAEAGQFFDEPANLRVWWLYAMVEGGHPLREKLTLFWHNHFATSYAKVRETKLMFAQNVTLRKHALGKFRPFLLEMSKDPAMLVWLDSNQNVKGAANENYAREVMELFSLGVGNYTEKDIKEVARAFTGWHVDSRPNQEGVEFTYKPDEHDNDVKTIFGKTGNWNGEDVVRLCCDQPACAKFLVGKLYAFLVSETPPPRGLLTPLEERFRASDYDIADLLKAMLGSRLFFSNHAYRKRVKWPVEYALGAVRAVTPGRVPLGDLVDPLAKMGQVLFAPPNVKGWRTGTDWLNSATLLARNNFAEVVALGEWSKGTVRKPTQTFAPVRPATVSGPASSSSPQAPDAAVDPVAILYSTKPTDVAAVVKRMGELLYGERITTAQATKLEKFLREPGPAPAPAKGPAMPKGSGLPPKTVGKETIKTADVPDKTPDKKTSEPTPKKPKTGEEPKNPGPPNLESAEFKTRVREALHAMMCLPEYQLN